MADMQHLLKEAWQQAMVGLDAAGTGVDKVLDQIAGAAGLTRADLKRHARDLGERLSSERHEVERAIDGAVKRAAARFRLASRDEVEELKGQLDRISHRVDELAKEQRAGE